ncbi:MAG: two-component system sensor histidine kinase NtrB, partial [Terriglobales bacterium]
MRYLKNGGVLRLLLLALAAAHIGSIVALGSQPPGPLISNLLQLAASLLAAGVCVARAQEVRGLSRRFFVLAALSLVFWTFGQASFTYYENFLEASIPSLSFTDVAFLSFYLPLAVLVFLRPAVETQKLEWTRALDLAQVGVVFSAVYLYYFFYLASFLHTRVAVLEWVVNIVYDVLNIFLIGGFLYRVLSPSDRAWRGLYGRLAAVWTLYAVGDTLYRYGLVVWGLKTGCWLDLAYSVPLLAMAAGFTTLPQVRDSAASTACDVEHGERVCFLLLILAPVAAMLLALDIVRTNFVLGSIILFSSFLLYSARLALTQYRKRQTLKMLRDAEMKFRLLFESNPQPMWVFAKDTLQFLEVNPAAAERYGYSREEFLALRLPDIRPEDEVPGLLKVLAQGTETTYSGQWRHRTKDGRVFEVEVAARNIAFAGRRARLVIINDVTERKLLEAQFRQAQKMEAVGTLAGGIAHDFNNLLTVISGYSYMLKESLADDRKLAEDIAQIEQAAEKAAALTRQLLAFSRRQVLEPTTIVLNDVVRGMEKMLRRVIGEDIELITVPSPDLGLVRA